MKSIFIQDDDTSELSKVDERRQREPELLRKLDEIIDRVKASRYEDTIDNSEVWTVTNALSKVDTPDLLCSYCGNNVRKRSESAIFLK